MVALFNDVLRNSQVSRRRYRRAALFDLGVLVAQTVSRWQQRAREKRELAGLDARELKDIGLTPADAQWLIDKPFWRD